MPSQRDAASANFQTTRPSWTPSVHRDRIKLCPNGCPNGRYVPHLRQTTGGSGWGGGRGAAWCPSGHPRPPHDMALPRKTTFSVAQIGTPCPASVPRHSPTVAPTRPLFHTPSGGGTGGDGKGAGTETGPRYRGMGTPTPSQNPQTRHRPQGHKGEGHLMAPKQRGPQGQLRFPLARATLKCQNNLTATTRAAAQTRVSVARAARRHRQ